eukprot:CAMPEP_0198672854 /NCGR_PEP_ID=MMETSP1467-20131203/93277_1 /TAXON_ID=1462469 /ORGANISM="unid. sp., Strain CCMP2135" /LENGTH=90 /DNA_ID=CAMNT_0044409697 /DNA_START=115 /DNA_END=385 /DNA_ORIENTATION=-
MMTPEQPTTTISAVAGAAAVSTCGVVELGDFGDGGGLEVAPLSAGDAGGAVRHERGRVGDGLSNARAAGQDEVGDRGQDGRQGRRTTGEE